MYFYEMIVNWKWIKKNHVKSSKELFAWFFNIFSIIFWSLSLTKEDLSEYNIWNNCHCTIIILLNCKLQVLRITDFWTCSIQLTCLTQPDTVWHDMTLFNMAWHYFTQPNTVWNGLTLFEMTWDCLTQPNNVWHGLTPFDMAWHSLTCYKFTQALPAGQPRI